MFKSLFDFPYRLASPQRTGGRRGKDNEHRHHVPTLKGLEDRMLLSGFLGLLPHDGDRPVAEIQFLQDMNPVSATDPANYRLVDPRGLDVSIDAATYDNVTDTVTLSLNGGEPLSEGDHKVFYQGGQIQTAAGETIPGDLDFAVAIANPDPQRVAIRRGEGDGSFITTFTLEMPDTPPWFITNGDLNGDGNADLVVGMPWRNQVRTSFGRGDGSFDEPLTYAVGDTPLNERRPR